MLPTGEQDQDGRPTSTTDTCQGLEYTSGDALSIRSCLQSLLESRRPVRQPEGMSYCCCRRHGRLEPWRHQEGAAGWRRCGVDPTGGGGWRVGGIPLTVVPPAIVNWAEWSFLMLRDRCWNVMVQDSLTVLPQSKVKKASGKLHGGPSEGYLGFNKIRNKVRCEWRHGEVVPTLCHLCSTSRGPKPGAGASRINITAGPCLTESSRHATGRGPALAA
jgi:hypothetical protein